MDVTSLHGKTALVTGAASGIGRATALALARRGADLVICDVDEAGLAACAEQIRGLGREVQAERVDVASAEQMASFAASVHARREAVDLLMNNAGVGIGGGFLDTSLADWDWIVGINFWGVVHGTKAFLPHLRAAGEGHVVNISSVFGLTAAPNHGAYNATKFAVRGFTEALRIELDATNAPVSATCVLPGGIRTSIARNARVRAGVEGTMAASDEMARELFERNCRTTASEAAQAILHGVSKNRRRVLVGWDACAIDLMVRAAPSAAQHVVLAATRRMAR